LRIKNDEIINAVDALNKLLGMRLPVKTSFQIAKLVTKLREPLENFSKVRDGLFKTYNVQSERGESPETVKLITKNPNDFSKFASEMEELLKLEMEIVVEPVKLPEKISSTCDQCHHNMDRMFEIEPSILLALEKFVSL